MSTGFECVSDAAMSDTEDYSMGGLRLQTPQCDWSISGANVGHQDPAAEHMVSPAIVRCNRLVLKCFFSI